MIRVFGHAKPPIIEEVEHKLWLVVFAIAKGERDVLVLLMRALNEINELLDSAYLEEISDWFSGEDPCS